MTQGMFPQLWMNTELKLLRTLFYKAPRVFNDSTTTAISLASDPLNQIYLSPLELSKGHGGVTQGTISSIGKERKCCLSLSTSTQLILCSQLINNTYYINLLSYTLPYSCSQVPLCNQHIFYFLQELLWHYLGWLTNLTETNLNSYHENRDTK